MQTNGETLKGAPWTVPDCARLAARHSRRKLLYAKAVGRLFAVGYLVTDAEHARLKADVEEARMQLEIARAELDKHATHFDDEAPASSSVRTAWRA